MKPLELLLIEASPPQSQCYQQRAGAAPHHRIERTNRPHNFGDRAPPGEAALAPISAEYAESLLLPHAEALVRFGDHLNVSDDLVTELERSDVVVVATPVYNFTVPAALKLWIDLVVRNGVTYKNTPEDKVGLLRDRPVLVAVTSGGAMFCDPPKQPDFFRPYLNAALGVIGLHSISYVQATGLAFADHPLDQVASQVDAWSASVLKGFIQSLPKDDP